MTDFDQLRKDFLSVDRRKEKIAFLKKWGKPIPPELLREGPKQRNPNVNPEAEPLHPLWHGAPSRFLVCRSPGQFNVMPVDRDGSCAPQKHVSAPWHLYRTYAPLAESRPVLLAIRCPNSLSTAEWDRTSASYGEAQAWGKANPWKPKSESTEITPTHNPPPDPDESYR